MSALLLSIAVCFSSMVFAADETVNRAKQQLDSGHAQEAYDLLKPLQSTRAGDPDFDFVLGSAALALGKNTEAVFALERVLAVQPNSAPARAQIARAYFNLKETETAKREFDNVKKQQAVPPEVSETIDRFLDAITRIEESQRTAIHGFVEIGLGYDTNVNSATGDSQIAPPLFGGTFTLSSASVKQGDSFVGFGGGVSFTHPFTKQLTLFGGLTYQNKTNFNKDDFSTYYYDLNLGLGYRVNKESFSVSAQLNSFFIDNPQLYSNSYRDAVGAIAQWQHDFDSRNQASLFAQYSSLTYPDQGGRAANRYVGGAGYAHAFGKGVFVTYAGLYGGTEREKDGNFPEVGNNLYGVRLGGQWNIDPAFSAFANASVERRLYGGPQPGYGFNRRDTQYNAGAGLIYTPKKNLHITPQVIWTDNRSNIDFSRYDRVIYQVTFRQDI
ncbi:MAG: surface lipoprotein assembly modifier [Betaproteobacteria bacterium]